MVKLKEEYIIFKNISLKLFGRLADRYSNRFKKLKPAIFGSGLKVFLRTYLSIMFFATSVLYALSLIMTAIISLALFDIVTAILYIIVIPIVIGALTFFTLYYYPFSKSRKRKRDIDFNLPFAIMHFSAIASSGIPPYSLFKVLSQFEEYGEIARECKRVVRNIDVFGLDEISAIKEVATRTPSSEFKQFLDGITTTIKTGGGIEKYLKNKSEKMMFSYTIKRERYNQLLSTYADFYTALLIAAPLLFITILSILGVMGGAIFGLPIQDVIRIGVFGVIPAMNILFLMFIHFTQPRM